jgi:hypothetical protein
MKQPVARVESAAAGSCSQSRITALEAPTVREIAEIDRPRPADAIAASRTTRECTYMNYRGSPTFSVPPVGFEPTHLSAVPFEGTMSSVPSQGP